MGHHLLGWWVEAWRRNRIMRLAAHQKVGLDEFEMPVGCWCPGGTSTSEPAVRGHRAREKMWEGAHEHGCQNQRERRRDQEAGLSPGDSQGQRRVEDGLLSADEEDPLNQGEPQTPRDSSSALSHLPLPSSVALAHPAIFLWTAVFPQVCLIASDLCTCYFLSRISRVM